MLFTFQGNFDEKHDVVANRFKKCIVSMLGTKVMVIAMSIILLVLAADIISIVARLI